jgi:hypothetical protein
MAKMRLWIGRLKMSVCEYILSLLELVSGILAIFPEFLCHSIFYYIPFISFYAKTKQCLEKIEKSLNSTDIVKFIQIDAETTEHFQDLIILLQRLNGKKDQNITEVKFDILPFNENDRFSERIAANSNYYLSVISNNKTIYKMIVDNKLSELNQTLDKMIRKRLAIIFLIFGIALILLEMLKH